MNMNRLRNVLLGVFLTCATIAASANELVLSGKAAQDAFKNEGVVWLLEAVIKGDKSEAKSLIANGVNINAVGEGGVTPLLWMELNRDVNAVGLLLDLGADPDKYIQRPPGESGFGPPVWMAAGAGQREILEVLLAHGGNPNLIFGTDTPLMMAVQESHLDCAELLLSHGADINLPVGPVTALTETMIHAQFADAVWVLNHGFSRDLPDARKMLFRKKPRAGQERLKEEALRIIDRRISEQAAK